MGSMMSYLQLVRVGGVLRQDRLDGESDGRNGQQGTDAHARNLPMLYCIK